MTKELRYALMDPTGNITVLVETPVPVEDQPITAGIVMAVAPTCEQVGFLMPPVPDCDIAIRMAGGEFCGNAAMCAATLHAMSLEIAGETTLQVSVSGTPVAVTVTPEGDGYACSVAMPRPLDIVTVHGLPVVHFEGICHAIATEPLTDEAAPALLWELCQELHPEAMGLMQLDAEAGTMKPLVYVPGTNALFWENSCGSGTSAVGAYLYSLSGQPVSARLRQPGGTLGVEVDGAGNIFLQGTARLMYRDTVYYL